MRGVKATIALKPAVRRFVHDVLIAVVRAVLLLFPQARRNQVVRRSMWTGAPIITLGVKAKAERLLGVRAESLVLSTYRTTDEFDINLASWMRWGPMRAVVPYLVFIWACVRYQRFHVFYNRGILPQLKPGEFNPDELSILRALGKQLFAYAYGADVRTQPRTRALGTIQLCAACPAPNRHCVCDERRGSENFQRVLSHATACFSLGDMIEYTPGSRNDLFYWPIDLDADRGRRYSAYFPPATSDAPPRIVHAPNHRFFKGTDHLIRSVDDLRRAGHPLELILVEGRSHREAIELYRSADLVFDQCVAGFHGYFALEALAMGKPVMCFIRRPDAYLLEPEQCPLISTSVATLADDLKHWISDRARLHEYGRRGRQYIERHYSLAAFAARLGRTYCELGIACPQGERREMENCYRPNFNGMDKAASTATARDAA